MIHHMVLLKVRSEVEREKVEAILESVTIYLQAIHQAGSGSF